MSEKIKRYDREHEDVPLDECESADGCMVLYSDHDREIAQRDARIGDLQGDIAAMERAQRECAAEANAALVRIVAERDTAREQLRKLRKAAIRFMGSDIAKKHSDYGCVDCIAEALKDIGEIPP